MIFFLLRQLLRREAPFAVPAAHAPLGAREMSLDCLVVGHALWVRADKYAGNFSGQLDLVLAAHLTALYYVERSLGGDERHTVACF